MNSETAKGDSPPDVNIMNPVFVCGHRKTGTTLLVSLLDAHPELLVYPDDSGFFYRYFPLCEHGELVQEDRISAVISGCIDNLRTAIGKLSEGDRVKASFNPDAMATAFAEMARDTPCDPADLLRVLMQSLARVRTCSGRETCWVEKTTSTEIYAQEIAGWYPDAKFIHILRDPRDNWASLKSGWSKRYAQFNDTPDRLMHSLLERGHLGMRMAASNQKALGKDNYQILRFEDLVANPEQVLKEICVFLGITFDDCLYHPTIFGFPWEGNNFDGQKFSGVSKDNADRWRDRISSQDAMLIESYFGSLMDDYNYTRRFDDADCARAAAEHYKWYNYSTQHSFRPVWAPQAGS